MRTVGNFDSDKPKSPLRSRQKDEDLKALDPSNLQDKSVKKVSLATMKRRKLQEMREKQETNPTNRYLT